MLKYENMNMKRPKQGMIQNQTLDWCWIDWK